MDHHVALHFLTLLIKGGSRRHTHPRWESSTAQRGKMGKQHHPQGGSGAVLGGWVGAGGGGEEQEEEGGGHRPPGPTETLMNVFTESVGLRIKSNNVKIGDVWCQSYFMGKPGSNSKVDKTSRMATREV